MNKELETIEIGRIPELVRIVEEVRKTKTPRILSRRRKPVAILRPYKNRTRRLKRAKTKADREAFLSSAGAWRDLVDTEKLKKDIYESRRISSRPPITL